MVSVWQISATEAFLIASTEPNFLIKALFRFNPTPEIAYLDCMLSGIKASLLL